MRYFYRLGAFEPSGSYHDKMIEINEMKRKAYSQIDTSRGMMMIGLVNNMEDMVRGLKPEIPKKFRHFGYDIRDWKHGNVFQEIDEVMYRNICELELGIMKNKGVIDSELVGWHCPVAIDNEEDVIESLCTQFGLKKVEIKN